jgi:hypothetical protein
MSTMKQRTEYDGIRTGNGEVTVALDSEAGRVWLSVVEGREVIPDLTEAGTDLTPEEARMVGRWLIQLADHLTVDVTGFDITKMAAAKMGIEMPTLAVMAGVDPASVPFTVADCSAMAEALGKELGRRARG